MIESRKFTIGDGAILVLYTDGLVENRGQDIDDGLARLRRVFGPEALLSPLEDLAKATLDGAYSDHERDDIAVLIARLRRLPEEHVVTMTLPARPSAVREARGKVRGTLGSWELDELSFTAELLVSELVTNALRYATGDIGLRMLLDRTLVFEVRDGSDALPRARQAADDDENGRGLQVVHRLAKRWGARLEGQGKVVWCEVDLPGGGDRVLESWPGATGKSGAQPTSGRWTGPARRARRTLGTRARKLTAQAAMRPDHARPGRDQSPVAVCFVPTRAGSVVCGAAISRQRFVMGRRRSRPKFFGVIFGPGGYCRRLYSAASTSRITRSTNAGSWPAAINASWPMSFST
jgi:anti-sigma regulatory factor (Ser/Thr protein kinase)